jgi:hypothetical protein
VCYFSNGANIAGRIRPKEKAMVTRKRPDRLTHRLHVMNTTPEFARLVEVHARVQGLSTAAWLRKAAVAALRAEGAMGMSPTQEYAAPHRSLIHQHAAA